MDFRRAGGLAAWTVLSLLVAVSPAGSAQAATATAPPTPAPAALPDRVVVEFEPKADGGDRADTRADADTSLETTLGSPRFQLVSPDRGQTVSGAIADLKADPDVRAVSPDYLSTPSAVPNDPLFDLQWALQNTGSGFLGKPAIAGSDIDATHAWDTSVGSYTTVVADIDTGYRFEHPDLLNPVWRNQTELAGTAGVDDDHNGYVDDSFGYDFVGAKLGDPADNDPTDDDLVSGGHGVHTAGILGATGNNAVGITGVAQQAVVMPLRVCSAYTNPTSGSSSSACSTSAIIAAVHYAARNGARVANLSLGGRSFSKPELDAFASWPDVLFVTSAGNDGVRHETSHRYPCDYDPGKSTVAGAIDNVVCVAATDQSDKLASFSDWGSANVDLGAPGTQILSTYNSQTVFTEDFEGGNFATRWREWEGGGMRLGRDENGFPSTMLTDSPGVPAHAGVERTSYTDFNVSAGLGNCTLYLREDYQQAAGDQLRIDVDIGGLVVAETNGTPGCGYRSIALGSKLEAGGVMRIWVSYATGLQPTSTSGVWIDDLHLDCDDAPVGLANGYASLDGTSMAAPQVTGTAALMFARKPRATVREVRNALLRTVDPLPSLSGRTTSGGRLDANRAVNALDFTAPTSAAGPPALANAAAIDVPYTGSDPESGLDEVELWVKGPGQSSYSRGATDTSPGATGGTIHYTATGGDGEYAFYTVARDIGRNAEAAPSGADGVTRLDTTAPTSAASGPATVASPSIDVAYAADGTGSALTRVELWVKAPEAENYELAGDDGAPVADGARFAYTAGGEGEYAFYTLAYDAAGNAESVPGERDATTSFKVPAQPVTPSQPSAPPAASLKAGACANPLIGTGKKALRLKGTSAGDWIVGVAANDVLSGLAGDDCLEGRGGNDTLNGGPGADRMRGGEGNDKLTGGSGTNRYSGGAGNDVIAAANGIRETIDCGSGRDSAVVDKRDRAVGCERITRR